MGTCIIYLLYNIYYNRICNPLHLHTHNICLCSFLNTIRLASDKLSKVPKPCMLIQPQRPLCESALAMLYNYIHNYIIIMHMYIIYIYIYISINQSINSIRVHHVTEVHYIGHSVVQNSTMTT